MKSQLTKTLAVTMTFIFAFTTVLFAQGNKSERPSPPATATGNIDGATITINYSSPGVKGRKIWGGLVPYNKIWRAGANEATLFKTDKDLQVAGKDLPAGTYSLFAIPGKKEWTIIFNSQTGQWGINKNGANLDPANNVLKVTVTPKETSKMYERLKYQINDDSFSLIWENLEVPIAVSR